MLSPPQSGAHRNDSVIVDGTKNLMGRFIRHFHAARTLRPAVACARKIMQGAAPVEVAYPFDAGVVIGPPLDQHAMPIIDIGVPLSAKPALLAARYSRC